MATQHNCAECRHLKRTSPTQVFLLCTYWAHPSHGTQAYDWTCRHCHLQPEAPACQFFKPYQGERIGDVRADAICFRAATA